MAPGRNERAREGAHEAAREWTRGPGLAEAASPIPRIVHQIWLQGADRVPDRYVPMRQSWLDSHPTWKHVLWDEESIRQLLAERFSWFLPTYRSYPTLHQKVDSARYFILREHGGFYADMDARCLRPLDGLLERFPRARLIVSRQPFGPLENRLIRLFVGTRHILTNAVMGSVPRLQAWEQVLRGLVCSAHRFAFLPEMSITYSTGPAFLSQALRPALRGDPGMVVLPARYFEPAFGYDEAGMARREALEADDRFVEHRQDATWHSPPLRWLFVRYFRVKHMLWGPQPCPER